jgi:hypothetical protein
MIKGNKNVFWEALILTLFVFLMGMILGIIYEKSKINEIRKYYQDSEINLMDIFIFNNFIESEINCENLINKNINFADRIYEEALLLEKYESASKINEEIEIEHKKYDLLRSFLWINVMKTKEKCDENFDLIVYLYEYKTDDLVKKANQNVWSKILYDLKQKRGNDIILIPIAADNGIISVNALVEKFEIDEYPSLIINDEEKLTSLNNIKDIEIYLK